MDTTSFTIHPSYGAELYITEQGKIAICQDQPGIDDVTIVLTPAEARLAIEHIQQLLLQIEQES